MEGCMRIENGLLWKNIGSTQIYAFMEQQYRNLIQLLLDDNFAFLSSVENNRTD